MIMFPIKSVSDLEKISAAVKWQYFEKLTAFIFEENGFDAKQNVIVKDEHYKRQFDVIAKRFDATWLVECKKWKSRKQRAGAMKSAAAKHLERCALYETVAKPGRIMPLIVTLIEEEVVQHDGIFIVPVTKLNWFVNNFESFE